MTTIDLDAAGPGAVHSGIRYVRPEVRALEGYRLARPGTHPDNPIRLDQNEAPADWPESVKQEVVARLLAEPWHRYPSLGAEPVCRALGELQGTPPEMVAPAVGADEALWAAFAVFAARGTVVMPSPTFSMVPILATAAGANAVDVPLGSGFSLDAEALLRAAHIHRAEVIYLACPNNPTGNALDVYAVRAVIEGAPGAVILDEAYWEFADATWLEAVWRYSHLVLVRTFSKAMAGAGLRLGWLTAQPDMVVEMTKIMPPYSINVFTQVAAPVLVAHRATAAERVRAIVAERARVAAALTAMGMRVYPSETNFLLFEPGVIPSAVCEGLAGRGVLVRDVSSAPRLSTCLRVSIGVREDNDRFLSDLGAVVAGLRGAEA